MSYRLNGLRDGEISPAGPINISPVVGPYQQAPESEPMGLPCDCNTISNMILTALATSLATTEIYVKGLDMRDDEVKRFIDMKRSYIFNLWH